MITWYDLVFVGLILDFAGAIILGEGLIRSKETMLQESATYLGRNVHLLRAGFVQRADAVVGLSVLAAGFALQFIGNLTTDTETLSLFRDGTYGTVATLTVMILVAAARWLSHLSAYRSYYLHTSREWTPETPPLREPSDRDDARYLDRNGSAMGLPRRRGEDDPSYLERLRERQQELGRLYGKRGSRRR